jgi:hypothetical protein
MQLLLAWRSSGNRGIPSSQSRRKRESPPVAIQKPFARPGATCGESSRAHFGVASRSSGHRQGPSAYLARACGTGPVCRWSAWASYLTLRRFCSTIIMQSTESRLMSGDERGCSLSSLDHFLDALRQAARTAASSPRWVILATIDPLPDLHDAAEAGRNEAPPALRVPAGHRLG